jgi:hypothetical protein
VLGSATATGPYWTNYFDVQLVVGNSRPESYAAPLWDFTS